MSIKVELKLGAVRDVSREVLERPDRFSTLKRVSFI
jgi:hypothetical protein